MNIDCPDCIKYIDNKCTSNRIGIINGKCTEELKDSVKYYQHKYVRGVLLPSIAEKMGEISTQYIHDFYLKPRWLHETTGEAFYTYKEYTDIPGKYKGSGRLWRLDNGNFAVIPSMSGFTLKEGKSYIDFLEKVLFMELEGAILEGLETDYVQLRKRIK
jgi:hypothetical protein